MATTSKLAGVSGAAPAPQPDFGKAGTIKVRTPPVAAVLVSVSDGEFLRYSLSVKSVAPVFVFACNHRKWLTDASKPQAQYSWTHFQKIGEDDAADDDYKVAFSFVGAPQTYTLKIEQCRHDGTTVTLADVDYTSTDPSDFMFSILRVFTA